MSVPRALGRPDDDPDDPRIPDGEDPDRNPPAYGPDIAIRFRDLGAERQGCLTDEEAEDLGATIERLLQQEPLFAGSRVIVDCIDSGIDAEGGRATVIGIWSPTASGDTPSRARGLQRVRFGTADPVAFRIAAGFLRRTVAARWDVVEKRWSGGRPDPHGPTYLNSYELTFEAPNVVTLQINGYDERPWPDIWFWIQYRDVVEVSGSQVTCTTELRRSSVPLRLKIWAGVQTFASLVLMIVPVAGWLLAGHFVGMMEVLRSSGTPPEMQGVACRILGLLPSEVPIPGTEKLVLTYLDRRVKRDGLYTSGFAVAVPREPSVRLVLPRRVSVDYRETVVVVNLQLILDDLRAPFTVTWTGAQTPAPNAIRGALYIPVSFSAPSPHRATQHRVVVEIVDADGLRASDEAVIDIYPVDVDDTSIPAVCKVKPWLDICDE